MIFLSCCGLVVLLLLPQQSHSRPEFAARIPNGDKVVAPSGEVWPGVGHERSGGGGSLNTFGQDFAKEGFQWTTDLCRRDSDCDGLPNGVELGDPNCVWKQGDEPQFDVGITHPGLPDTERSAFVQSGGPGQGGGGCSNFRYDDLPQTYQNTSLVMPSYQVPKDRTTYAKFAFEAPTNPDEEARYAIRIEPIIDKAEVTHHILLYGCQQRPSESLFGTPDTAGKMPCNDLVYAWAVGGSALCLPESVGMELEYQWYALDVHYDNPSGKRDIVDNSGVKVTHLPKSDIPNVQAAGYIWAGASLPSVRVPPGRNSYEVTAECDFQSIPPSGVSVFAYFLHAHLLGRKIWTEVERTASHVSEENCPLDCGARLEGLCHLCWSTEGCCGSLDGSKCQGDSCCSDCTLCEGCEQCYGAVDPNCRGGSSTGGKLSDLPTEKFDIGCDTRYDFDLQELRQLPIQSKLYPSDKLVTHCVYDSTERKSMTYGGDETENEMCIAFYLYYPKQQQDMECMTRASLDAGDGRHVCNIPGQAVLVDELQRCEHARLESSSETRNKTRIPTWLIVHVLCMFVAWGIVISIGVLIPMAFRNAFKETERWFHWHRRLQIFGLFLVLIGFIMAVANVSLHFAEPHHKIGWITVILGLLQPINAVFRPHNTEEGRQQQMTATRRSAWELLHKNSGRLTVVLAWANVFFGIRLLSDWYGVSSGAAISLVVCQGILISASLITAMYRYATQKAVNNSVDEDPLATDSNNIVKPNPNGTVV